jgi:hypothetical protein
MFEIALNDDQQVSFGLLTVPITAVIVNATPDRKRVTEIPATLEWTGFVPRT